MTSPYTMIGRAVSQLGRCRLLLVNRQMEGVAVRYMSEEGAVRKSGGAFAKRSSTAEEEYIRRQQAEQLKALQKTLKHMRLDKIEYHEKQLKRHLDKIKKHEDLMKKNNDTSHKIYIDSHKESAEAHKLYLEKLRKET